MALLDDGHAEGLSEVLFPVPGGPRKSRVRRYLILSPPLL